MATAHAQAQTDKKKTYIIFFDLKSAFDEVNWQLLIQKLIFKRYPTNLIKTIEILLSNIQASTDAKQPKGKILKGVPQGGVLSPKLFNTFIDDLSAEINKKYKGYLFADDLAILVHKMKNLKESIELVENWCIRNHMILNKQKCGIIKLTNRAGELSQKI